MSRNTTISTGHPNLDSILGGGWPVGPDSWQPQGLGSEPVIRPATRIAEIYGSSGSGRVAVACSTIVTALEAGKRVLLIDCKNSEIGWRTELAKAMQRFCTESRQSQIKLADLCNDPETALFVLEHAKGFDLIVLCTASFAPSNCARQASADQRRLNNTLRKVASWQRNATLLVITEQTYPAAVDFGQPSTSTSGNATKYYSWTRLHVRKISSICRGVALCKAKTVKNKQAAPFQSCSFEVSDGILQP